MPDPAARPAPDEREVVQAMTGLSVESQSWPQNEGHRRWLQAQAEDLFAFFEDESFDPAGGFHSIDNAGRAIASDSARPLHATTRMVHCFAIGHLLGRPGADDFVDHGMNAILNRHRDAKNGGYFWSFDNHGPRACMQTLPDAPVAEIGWVRPVPADLRVRVGRVD